MFEFFELCIRKAMSLVFDLFHVLQMDCQIVDFGASLDPTMDETATSLGLCHAFPYGLNLKTIIGH